ncbi:MAG TPA: DUF1570 domain-containing protein [Pirellulales bacterium]|jgi:hypothetical protein
MRFFVAVWFAAFTFATLAVAADSSRRTFELDTRGGRIEGTPLVQTARGLELLGRDGRIWTLPGDDARRLKPMAASFQSYSTAVLRNRLQDELGRSFKIVGAGHYVVALPEGVRTNWAERFDELYRSFQLYFSVRGFPMQEPTFPLTAIVWPDQESYQRAARAEGANVGQGVVGHYSPITNRIMLYDMSAGKGGAAELRETSATLIHEATHQTAFNTGVHQRFGPSPRWLVEGLGMMFEAPGVWSSRSFPRREDRINRDRLNYFQKRIAAGQKPERLQELVSSDRLFSSEPLAAYAEAWALSFYLVENEPRKYCDYLALTARRPAFRQYSPTERLADFTSVFGDNFRMHEARMLRFIGDLH